MELHVGRTGRMGTPPAHYFPVIDNEVFRIMYLFELLEPTWGTCQTSHTRFISHYAHNNAIAY